MTLKKDRFSPEEIEILEPTEKLAFVGTVTPEGFPHLSLITSLQPLTPKQMILAEFISGESKKNIKMNNKIGFLMMSLNRYLCRGTAKWTGSKTEGTEFLLMNQKPTFRYSAYAGVNRIHYFDLVDTTEHEKLPLGRFILAVLKTKFIKGAAKTKIKEPILAPFTMKMFNGIASMKFISHLDDNGFPVIIPLLQCQAADSSRLAFSISVYKEEIEKIPEGSTVAVFAMTLQMESVLIRGIYKGIKKYCGMRLGTIDINWVYNSMPPVHRQIYPEVDINPVTNF